MSILQSFRCCRSLSFSVAILIPFVVQAESSECTSRAGIAYPGFLSGQEFLDMSLGSQVDYTIGYIDALLSTSITGISEGCVTTLNECFRGRTSTQMAAYLRKKVEIEPEFWHLPANVLVSNAILDLCKLRG